MVTAELGMAVPETASVSPGLYVVLFGIIIGADSTNGLKNTATKMGKMRKVANLILVIVDIR